MKRKSVVSAAALAAICLSNVAVVDVAEAFNMNRMFNPSRWFGDSDRDYDRGYYRYGPYGPYGYGGGPYGWGGPYGGWGGPYGYGGYPGYGGYGGYPGYGGAPSTIVVNPSTGGSSTQSAPPPAPRLPE
jgi:hypothetical protein